MRMNLVGPQKFLPQSACAIVRSASRHRHFSRSGHRTLFASKHSGCWRQTIIKKPAHLIGQFLHKPLSIGD